ncbi:MAG: hypothetical protein IJ520_12535, partial [Synergistaceae bacterium]|nr:hypothetical protein [Synergistaceae bacterium]
LTATPHNGNDKEFQQFMSLIDPDRYDGAAHANSRADVQDVMRRLVKEDLVTFSGKPLFPERRAYTVGYDLSEQEKNLYEAVTAYVRDEFNRADRLDRNHRNMVGFALTVLQRRLASSPEAIYQSLKRRRERLERNLKLNALNNFNNNYDDYNNDELKLADRELLEDETASRASASRSKYELEQEISRLKELEAQANIVRYSGDDKKWNELSHLLQDNQQFKKVKNEKLIIFTEHRDTLNYLADKINSLIGQASQSVKVLTIHGAMTRDERAKSENIFKNDVNSRILIATDAAGEGINLQSAHLMVNYDLPWNPNRIEQRFGRIHRIGQTEVCHLWNLLARDTREGDVFLTLFAKLEEERAALGGKVFDVLGEIKFGDEPLRDLLIKAIRYGNDPEVRAKLNETVEHSFNTDEIKKLLSQNALVKNSFSIESITQIKTDLERSEANKLQPHFISAFFIEAFKQLGGNIKPLQERGIYKITGFKNNLDAKYGRICFDKSLKDINTEFITPAHPLFKTVIDMTLERSRDLIKRGAVLI